MGKLPPSGGVAIKAVTPTACALVHTGKASEDVPFLAATGAPSTAIAVVAQTPHLIGQAPFPLLISGEARLAPPGTGRSSACRVETLSEASALPGGVVPTTAPAAVAVDGPKLEVAVLLPVAAVGSPVVVADALRDVPAALGPVRHRLPTSPSSFPGAAAGTKPGAGVLVTRSEETLDDEAAVAALVTTVRRAAKDGVKATMMGERPIREVQAVVGDVAEVGVRQVRRPHKAAPDAVRLVLHPRWGLPPGRKPRGGMTFRV